eukprot:278773-Chlamydomonas_euryale.AAC.3
MQIISWTSEGAAGGRLKGAVHFLSGQKRDEPHRRPKSICMERGLRASLLVEGREGGRAGPHAARRATRPRSAGLPILCCLGDAARGAAACASAGRCTCGELPQTVTTPTTSPMPSAPGTIGAAPALAPASVAAGPACRRALCPLMPMPMPRRARRPLRRVPPAAPSARLGAESGAANGQRLLAAAAAAGPMHAAGWI